MTMVIRFLIHGLYLAESLKLAATSPQHYATAIIFFLGGGMLLLDYGSLFDRNFEKLKKIKQLNFYWRLILNISDMMTGL